MKTRANRFAAFLGGLLLTLLSLTAADVKAQGASFQVFYDQLSPYGQWIMDPEYGYVWIPNAGPSFRPYYTAGHWVYSPYGAMWVSDYPWGWAAFHYGRWTFNPFYGWVWIPGNVWGPAWVSWRHGGGHYGWAPLGPGVNVHVAIGGYSCPNDWWIFVPHKHFLSHNFHKHYHGPSYNTTIIKNTTIINNTYVNNNVTYVSGPSVNQVQQQVGKPVPVYNVNETTNPGKTQVQGKQVQIYRPAVNQLATGPKVAPKEVLKVDKPVGRPEPVLSKSTDHFNPAKVQRIQNPQDARELERRSTPKEVQQKQNVPAERNVNQRQEQKQVDRAPANNRVIEQKTAPEIRGKEPARNTNPNLQQRKPEQSSPAQTKPQQPVKQQQQIQRSTPAPQQTRPQEPARQPQQIQRSTPAPRVAPAPKQQAPQQEQKRVSNPR